MNLDLNALLEVAREAAETPGGFTVEEIAGVALDLAAVHTDVSEALEPLKTFLRKEASARLIRGEGKDHRVAFSGVDEDGDLCGVVTVTFPEKQARLPKEADVEQLKEDLGSAFEVYFETLVTHKARKGLPSILQKRLKEGETVETETVLIAVEYPDPTPRVGFKPEKK